MIDDAHAPSLFYGMANALVRPLTHHDYRELPEGGPRYQLIDGELHMSPSPNLIHQRIVGRLHVLIANFLQKKPLGEVLCAPIDVYLSEINVFQPDLVYVSKESAGILKKDGLHGAPDLVMEILSPATQKFDLGVKKHAYARCGIREYWIVDPDMEQIQVYHFEKSADEPSATHRKEARFHTNILPELTVVAETIFGINRGL